MIIVPFATSMSAGEVEQYALEVKNDILDNNWQGIMMGESGQIWLGSIENGLGEWELKIIAINGMFAQ